MRDLAFVAFLLAFLGMGLKRPFLFVLAYAYVDIVAPQRLTYYLLNLVPVSLIVFGLALLGYLVHDRKKDSRFSARQVVMVLLLGYCGMTTIQADFPVAALEKWDWVWKALVFAIFLPLTLRTKLRLESLALFMVLCAASIIITGGIKTIASGGGGYGVLQLLVSDNFGLYEGSTMSCVAIALIPLILWLSKYGTVFPPDWRVKSFAYALVFACLLIPVGTQTRTGLVCIGVLAVLMLRFSRYRLVYAGLAGVAMLIAIPFLPQSFTDRMGTIQDYQADQSASTRVAVWGWTWNYAKENPFGGGFEAYLQNKVTIELVDETGTGGPVTDIEVQETEDAGRAYHSAYFEMLGEQGFPGLALWLFIHIGGVWRMEWLRRQYRKRDREDEKWVAPLALALQNGHIVYLVGALFIGIAFQPFIYMLVGLQIGLDTYLARRRKEASRKLVSGRNKPETPPASSSMAEQT